MNESPNSYNNTPVTTPAGFVVMVYPGPARGWRPASYGKAGDVHPEVLADRGSVTLFRDKAQADAAIESAVIKARVNGWDWHKSSKWMVIKANEFVGV